MGLAGKPATRRARLPDGLGCMTRVVAHERHVERV